ncbi:MAG TPA: enoyl-CoA hydratase/isomerase family protein [Burkholderiales bacterium]|jgi:enoyl-CoA hydratase/carnithine racemase|nr:enoyl-CoA hydratase/isomerase family protein [Burkholderiales bacterium]
MNKLRIERKGAIRILTLNRPEKRNALDTALSRALLEALRAADADEAVRCVVLTGAGPAFCAGADLSEFKGLRDPQAAETRAELTMQLHLAFSKMVTPVVTAINGAAMGGGAGLAIAGDLAVMAQGAKLGYPETKHGIVAAIVMANLVRQVGRKSAFELVALGEPIDAKRALALGMVNRVVTKARLMKTALALAARLAAVNKPAMAQTKTLFHEVADLPLERALERGRDANKRMRNFQKPDERT